MNINIYLNPVEEDMLIAQRLFSSSKESGKIKERGIIPSSFLPVFKDI